MILDEKKLNKIINELEIERDSHSKLSAEYIERNEIIFMILKVVRQCSV